MKYIVIPANIINSISKEKIGELGLCLRYNIDNTKVIMHIEHYEQLEIEDGDALQEMGINKLSKSMIEDDDIYKTYPHPTYDNPSDELTSLLNSEDWNGEA